jgi:cation transport regulator ChaB
MGAIDDQGCENSPPEHRTAGVALNREALVQALSGLLSAPGGLTMSIVAWVTLTVPVCLPTTRLVAPCRWPTISTTASFKSSVVGSRWGRGTLGRGSSAGLLVSHRRLHSCEHVSALHRVGQWVAEPFASASTKSGASDARRTTSSRVASAKEVAWARVTADSEQFLKDDHAVHTFLVHMIGTRCFRMPPTNSCAIRCDSGDSIGKTCRQRPRRCSPTPSC